MLELRDYQKEAVEAGLKHLKQEKPKPGIIVCPTGCGKSLVISNLAIRLGEPVLVLQPSKEILLQNYEKAKAFGAEPTIWSASCNIKDLSPLTYATLGSVKKMAEDFKSIGVRTILVDECHSQYSADPGSMFMKFLKGIPKARVLGFTATPCKLHQCTSLAEGNYSKLNMLMYDQPSFFKEMVYVSQIQDMVKKGYWTKLKYEVWDFDTSGLVLNSAGSEYTETSIAACIQRNGINNTLYMRLLALWNEREHILVCMDTVKNCHLMSEFINKEKGYEATAVVDAKTPKKEREDIIKRFKDGKLKAVFNYSALALGFDFPELDCVVFGRPTFSFSVWYQLLGRSVRPSGKKKDALIVDCCNNYAKFGRAEDISIENVPYRGWCMFSGEKLISGIRMGLDVRRKQIMEIAKWKAALMQNRKGIKEERDTKTGREKLGIRHERATFPFGKYFGNPLWDTPMDYLKWATENIPNKGDFMRKLNEYYSDAKQYREATN